MPQATVAGAVARELILSLGSSAHPWAVAEEGAKAEAALVAAAAAEERKRSSKARKAKQAKAREARRARQVRRSTQRASRRARETGPWPWALGQAALVPLGPWPTLGSPAPLQHGQVRGQNGAFTAKLGPAFSLQPTPTPTPGVRKFRGSGRSKGPATLALLLDLRAVVKPAAIAKKGHGSVIVVMADGDTGDGAGGSRRPGLRDRGERRPTGRWSPPDQAGGAAAGNPPRGNKRRRPTTTRPTSDDDKRPWLAVCESNTGDQFIIIHHAPPAWGALLTRGVSMQRWNNGDWPNAPSGSKKLGIWRMCATRSDAVAFFEEQVNRMGMGNRFRFPAAALIENGLHRLARHLPVQVLRHEQSAATLRQAGVDVQAMLAALRREALPFADADAEAEETADEPPPPAPVPRIPAEGTSEGASASPASGVTSASAATPPPQDAATHIATAIAQALILVMQGQAGPTGTPGNPTTPADVGNALSALLNGATPAPSTDRTAPPASPEPHTTATAPGPTSPDRRPTAPSSPAASTEQTRAPRRRPPSCNPASRNTPPASPLLRRAESLPSRLPGSIPAVCRYHLGGYCRRGAECPFQHPR